ncbi:GAD-like domain-containing protein [Roseateles sp. LKC17W]|uniref:GAD-like domain-containing protein n=1 Tax=Pelomonas margarita TaxID=3299031 RepID=A0ABW7FP47_9BURK
MRDDDYLFLVERLGEPTLTRVVPTALIRNSCGVLPELLLTYWKTEGFNQFKHGLYSSVNPEEWQGVVDEWLAGTVFEQFGRFYALTRTAFGELRLFNQQIGSAVTLNPLCGEISSRSMRLVQPDRLHIEIGLLFSPKPDHWDMLDHEDKYLFDRALKKLGPLAMDEMYGFEPSLLLGGPAKLENLVKVDAYTHCALLRRLIDKPWVPFTDIGEALGVDTAELARQAIEEHRAKGG